MKRGVREEALKPWIASSASTGGATTFLEVLEGGATHYFVSKQGGADKKIRGYSANPMHLLSGPVRPIFFLRAARGISEYLWQHYVLHTHAFSGLP